MSKKDKKKIAILCVIFVITLVNVLYENFFVKQEYDIVDVYDEIDYGKINYAHFIDAGQGDCTLLQTSEGKFVLIDTSTDSESCKVVSYLENAGVENIEYLILTHPHEDHIGGADEVLSEFVVKNVVMTDKVETTACYERLVGALKESKHENNTNVILADYLENFKVDDLDFTLISDTSLYDDLNNSSICLKINYGQTGLLFTGDAEKTVERDVLQSDVEINADIYKCAHHGSSTSNSSDFLDEVDMSIAVISCGLDNMYGHPHDEVVDSLAKRNVEIYRTYKDGDIVVEFDDADNFRVVTSY